MSARGEGTIRVDGREVTVLFTNRALVQAEKQMGKSVIGVVNGGYERLGLSELVVLLRSGMEAAHRDNGETVRVTLDDAYEVLDLAGFTSVYGVVVKGISDVISYSQNGDEPDPN